MRNSTIMNCKKCDTRCIKNGFQYNGVQRYLCTLCNLSQQKAYHYNACKKNINNSIVKLLVNSCEIRDISRILHISKTTVTSRVLKISKAIRWLPIYEYNQIYEVDELCAKLKGQKHCCWVSYSINRKTKQVIDFSIGSNNKEKLGKIIKSVLRLNPKKIYTDGLPVYKSLIPSEIHSTRKYQTNTIERFNLNLRTHLKRLSRKTICYSKNARMLEAIINIYFCFFNRRAIAKKGFNSSMLALK